MDKPLKYFLLVTAVFITLIGVFVLGIFTKRQEPQEGLTYVDESDSLMVRAKKLASENRSMLFNLYKEHPDVTFVRFSFEPVRNRVEHIWGKVISFDSVNVSIQPLRKSGTEDIYYPENLKLLTDSIEDWLVALPDGRIRGGYTSQVMLLKEKEIPKSNIDSLEKQLKLFVDSAF